MPDIMGQMDIAFPNLNIYLENVPKNFTVFGFTIALYGVIIGLGFFLALILISKVAKATGQNPDTYWDAATYIIIFSIIGARLYYVFFAWDFYKDDPISILYIRNGGLAIYGGVIGGFLTAFIFCKIKKKSFLQLTDTIMPGLLLGQTMGRWGNFTNREAFGEYTDGLLAMRLPVDAVRSGEITELMRTHMSDATNFVQVSPTFLYESLWNCTLLILLLIAHKNDTRPQAGRGPPLSAGALLRRFYGSGACPQDSAITGLTRRGGAGITIRSFRCRAPARTPSGSRS